MAMISDGIRPFLPVRSGRVTSCEDLSFRTFPTILFVAIVASEHHCTGFFYQKCVLVWISNERFSTCCLSNISDYTDVHIGEKPMPRKKSAPKTPTTVESLKHKDTRSNIPTREQGAMVAEDE